jgi:UDP-N-acetylglucosamine:LPS N-acetylglucosamine transferase
MKKILIFSSYGGGGHTAVTKALTSYLKDDYEVISTNIFNDVLGCIDPIKKFSFGRSGEDLYNYLMPRKWYRFLNTYYKIGSFYFNMRHKKVCAMIRLYIEQHNPDMIISVIPIVNNCILEIAQELNIPFLLIPTDLDITTFTQYIKAPSYKKFKIALPFEDQEALQRIAENQISLEYVDITGFIIRPDFFEEKNKINIKSFYQIPQDKPVILLLLGAVGLNDLYIFSKELSKLTSPAHIIICTGRKESLKDKIERIGFPPHITKTIVGYTERISDLMAVADLFITKSGSVSVCEAIYMNLPMLLDATIQPLAWEQSNHRFIKKYSLGGAIKDHSSISSMIDNILSYKFLPAFKNNLCQLPKKHGGSEIKKFIEQMLKS